MIQDKMTIDEVLDVLNSRTNEYQTILGSSYSISPFNTSNIVSTQNSNNGIIDDVFGSNQIDLSVGMTGKQARNIINSNHNEIINNRKYEIKRLKYGSDLITTIIAHRDNYKLARYGGKLLFSNDGGTNWVNEVVFADAYNIPTAAISKNGNIIWFTHSNKIYASYDQLSTYQELTLKDIDGEDYVFHTPVNPAYPGSYFITLNAPIQRVVNGQDICVFGSYATNGYGANPVLIYYSADSFQTIRVAYKFGQNTRYRDNGGPNQESIGNLVGDASNNLTVRHVHGTAYDDLTDTWVAFTGDILEENLLLNGNYDSANDSWTWVKYHDGASDPRIKFGGCMFHNGIITWNSDKTDGSNSDDYGVFRCMYSDIKDKSKHIRVMEADTIMVGMGGVNDNGIFQLYNEATGEPPRKTFFYTKNGIDYVRCYIPSSSFSPDYKKFHEPDSDGYFLINLTFKTNQGSWLIKPI